MSTTPRTDANTIAGTVILHNGQCTAQMVPSNFARKLENELAAAKAERDLAITRVASILWSGAIDKHTCGDVQKWVEDYTAELAAMQARAEKAEEQFKILNETMQHVTVMYDNAMVRADKAEAEVELDEDLHKLLEAQLKKAEVDTARLDWLDENMGYSGGGSGKTYTFFTPADVECGMLRDAIDAAMKEASK